MKTILRTKFALDLFESEFDLLLSLHIQFTIIAVDPYPYTDYESTLRTSQTRTLLHQMEQETIVLLENHGVLPLANDTKSIALIGPQMGRVSVSLARLVPRVV